MGGGAAWKPDGQESPAGQPLLLPVDTPAPRCLPFPAPHTHSLLPPRRRATETPALLLSSKHTRKEGSWEMERCLHRCACPKCGAWLCVSHAGAGRGPGSADSHPSLGPASPHLPRSWMASSNLFSSMAFCTSFVLKKRNSTD